MAKLVYILDTRSGKEDHPLKLRISHGRGSAVYLGTGIRLKPGQWDGKEIVGHKKAETLNSFITARKKNAEDILLRMELAGIIDDYSAADLKKIIENNGEKPVENDDSKGMFLQRFILAIESKKKESTRQSYEQSLRRLQEFDPLLDAKTFEDIDVRYLEAFDRWMTDRGIRQNSRNVYYRNIRAVFNAAIDDELTHAYPFRKFKIRKVTTRKRSLTADELRLLRDYPCEEWQAKYRDLFMLMFYLIGINGADLFTATKKQVRNGRLEYERAKTYKAYSVKIEPEAQALIDRYKGDKMLLEFCEGGKGHSYILQRMSRELKKIGPYERAGRGGKKTVTPLFPELTQYWCRHSWATIAAELDIPKETIAAALGHDMGNATTAIYINFNQRKVDEANRRVIDFLNGR